MSNHQGDSVNREASRAGQSATERAELDRMNRENAEAARTSGR